MKRSDFGIVFLHWLMAVSLIGVSITGLLYLYKDYRPSFAWLFEPDIVGPIHIGLSVAVVVFLISYLIYLKQANLLERLSPRFTGLIVKGQVRWKYVMNLFYMLLLIVIFVETFSGVLLTKLIDGSTLSQIFYIQRTQLISLHLGLVYFILAFPVIHVLLQWMDGGYRKLTSIFRPQFFPRRPSLVNITIAMKEENKKLRDKVKKYESASRRSDNVPAQPSRCGTNTKPVC